MSPQWRSNFARKGARRLVYFVRRGRDIRVNRRGGGSVEEVGKVPIRCLTPAGRDW